MIWYDKKVGRGKTCEQRFYIFKTSGYNDSIEAVHEERKTIE